MSGPKTSHYSIQAARQREQARRHAEERRRREEIAARVAAALRKHSGLDKTATRLSRAIEQLRERFPAEKIDVVMPDCAVPETEDPSRLEDFVGKLDKELLQAETALRNAGEQAQANQDFRSATRSAAELCQGTASTAEEAMQRFVESRAAKPSQSTMTERRADINRILGRQGSERWREATPKLERLVMEALSVDSDFRFSALTTEIRLQVQDMRKLDGIRNANAEKAKALLDRLESGIQWGEEPLKQRLELVRVGAIAFSEDLETLVRNAVANAEETAKEQLQVSAAKIVKETLSDLGYDVAPIEETLFARGGKVYFRKAGWKNYCVRLTVRPDESKLNFNVVRIEERTNDRDSSSREADIEAENAWCSGYQQFVDTLAARGLDTQLRRHLPVGAVPVQMVGSDEIKLSAFGTQENKRKSVKKAISRRGDTR